MLKNKKRRIHYVLSSHWDREWYQPFQDLRWRLVELLDGVMDGWEKGCLYGPFQMDGQAIMLEDYLEVRPEQRAKVESYARDGRFIIGPWYVLPDEFLVSGESLIRNIRHGRQIARDIGAIPSNAGFVCDLFGHISQLPQILSGFGIRGGFLWRGLNCPETRHIMWRGADGTELPCYKFGRNGYCDYAFDVRRASEENKFFDAERVRKDIVQYLDQEFGLTKLDPVLLFDGGDHQQWDADVYDVLIKYFKEHSDEIDGVHSSLDQYLNDMLAQSDCIKDVVEGELRGPGRYSAEQDQQSLIPGVLSSRVELKQSNALCQTLLCNWAEPLSVMATIRLGKQNQTGFLDLAWKWLLKNHPHDSICGCSIDAVHEDMKFRFSQCRQIAERIAIESASTIAASVDGVIADNELRVTVFNPLPYALNEPVDLLLNIPIEWSKFSEFFGFEDKPSFRIYDMQGDEILYQRVGQKLNCSKTRLPATKFPQKYMTHDVAVTLAIKIPPLGYTTLTVRSVESDKITRCPDNSSLVFNNHTIENRYLRVEVKPNGTVMLTDKKENQIYEHLLLLEDSADIGDGWYHGIAVNDERYTSVASHADVALISSGPYMSILKVRVHLRVPQHFNFDCMCRSEDFSDLVVEHVLRVRSDVSHLEVETTVRNTVKNHRLRVLLPSGATAAKTYFADSAFDVVERPIALRSDNHTYREIEVETTPQQSWTGVFDNQRGLAVISTGLMESTVCDLPERPLALTLFRATSKTVGTDGEPDGQLQKNLTFNYWIKPLTDKPNRVELFNMGQRLAAGLFNIQLTAKDVPLYSIGKSISASEGFLEIHGGAVMTSLRQVEEGLEVRLFNPESHEIQATLEFSNCAEVINAVQSVCAVDFESHPLAPPHSLLNGKYTVMMKSKHILTLRFE